MENVDVKLLLKKMNKKRDLEAILEDYTIEERDKIDQFRINRNEKIIYVEKNANLVKKFFNFYCAGDIIYNNLEDTPENYVKAYKNINKDLENPCVLESYMDLYLRK